MATEGATIHLTLQTALPLNQNPENLARDQLSSIPQLNTRQLLLIQKTLETVRKAAASCLRRFKPHQNMLWWTPLKTDEFGDPLIDEESGGFAGTGQKRISGEIQVILKLREVAPITAFELPAVIKDGIHHKVADLLRSYAQRKLDPAFAEKTSYPEIDEGFPIVWQGGFKFLEHSETGKVLLYAPLFPRGGHQEDLRTHFDPKKGPMLQEFGTHQIISLNRARGGLLLPLRFDKWGEATFMRNLNNPPHWKATKRPYDRRWMEELKRNKDFAPKRIELFVREDRVFVNIACEVQCKPPVEAENFMGVALGLEHLLTMVVINGKGEILHQHQISATEYQNTVFKKLAELHAGRGGPFFQILETFHYELMQEVIAETLHFKAMLAVETVGNIAKGKYSPRFNLRLSYWPFGKLADILGYKAQLAGLPKPYRVYSTTVRGLCSNCGAANKNGTQQIALEGSSYYCGNCNKKGNSGFNAALNLARRARELHLKGVTAR